MAHPSIASIVVARCLAIGPQQGTDALDTLDIILWQVRPLLVQVNKRLRRVLKESVVSFNQARSNQGIQQRIPEPREPAIISGRETGKVIGFPVLGGLHLEYRRAA
jgi:hypothetical protein